jgi:Leucine-rich repeat (LRR) protein
MASKLVDIIQSIDSGERFTSLDLSKCDLTNIPSSLYKLADCLEFLNLGDNHLTDLPSEFTAFHNLRILFMPQNLFQHIPVVLGSLKSLYMLSMKSNQILTIPEESLSISLGWLILTSNRIEQLPESIGKLSNLRKLMLAGNHLINLPQSISKCESLELIRISANNIEEIPISLFELPKLSWIAISGNPLCNKVKRISGKYV